MRATSLLLRATFGTLVTACATVAPQPLLDAGPGMPPEEGAVTASCSPDGWCWESPLPQGNTLTAAWAVAPTDAWFVGARGTVVHWDGAAWTVMHTPSHEDLVDVWASGATDVWVRGSTLLHWDGTTWAPPGHDGVDVWGSGPGDVWVAGDGVWRFDGRGWSHVVLPGSVGASTVSGSGPNDVWITPRYDGSGHADRRLFHWDGASLVTLTLPPDPSGNDDIIEQVWSVGGDDAWIACSYHVWHWDGGSFRQIPPPDDTRPGTSWGGRIWGTGADDVWILGEDQAGAPTQRWAIFRWDGATWSVTTAPTGMSGLVGTGPSDAWLVGSGGRVMHWNGSAWVLALPRSLVPSAPQSFVDAWSDGQTIRAVGRDITASGDVTSALWRFDGHAWGIEDVGATGVGYVAGSAPDDVWAATRDAIVHFDGTRWSPSPSDVDLSGGISAVWARARDDAWAGIHGASGPVVVHWDGARWSAWPEYVPSTTAATITSFGGTAADDVWIATDDWYPTATAHVAYWDGTTLVPDVSGFFGWRHVDPRIGILGNARGDAWIAGCHSILHLGSTADDGGAFPPTGGGSGCDYDAEIVLAREPSGRIWATRGLGTMLTFDGTRWTESDTGAGVGLHALVSDATNTVRALGDDAAILVHAP